MRALQFFLLGFVGVGSTLVAAPSIKASPTALAFTYQEGSATLPAAQSLAVSAASGAAATLVVANSGSSQWLTFSPQLGKTALAIRVSVNPTSLPIGQYAENIILATPETGGDPVIVPITLTVRAAPSDLRVSPTTLTFVYRLGEGVPWPIPVGLTTTGGLLSYSAAAGTKWLRVTPASGAVFPGFRSTISVGVDTTDLPPGSQKGTVTISSPDAITKSSTVTVTLTIQPGIPVANSIWPPRINVGAPDSTVTISGERFFSGTTVKSGTAVLKTTFLSPNAINVVVPGTMLASPGTVPLIVSNPDPGGGSASTLFFEVLPPGPLVLSVVNAASQLPMPLAPGAVTTIYGTGLGPDILAVFDGTTTFLPTTLGTTRVLMNGTPLPLIYSSAKQVSFVAPNNMEVDRAYMLEVEYGTLRSWAYPILSNAASPALFTTNGTGTGNAAAFQVDPLTNSYSLNNDKTPATKGSILVLYATGIAPILPIPPSGFIPSNASNNNIRGISVLLGDSTAEVVYAGYSPGLVSGIVQINAKVPDDVPTGKAIPILLKVAGVTSQAGVTLNIK